MDIYNSTDSVVFYFGYTYQYLHNIPRQLFNGTSVQNSLFLADINSYIESLGLVAITIISPGVLSFLIFLGLLIYFGCCQKDGVDEEEEKLSHSSIKFVFNFCLVVDWIIFLVILVFFCMGIYYYWSPFATIVDHLKQTASDQSKLIALTLEEWNSVDNSTATLSYYQSLLSSVQSTEDTSTCAVFYIQQSEIFLKFFAILGVVCCFILIVVSMMATVLQNYKGSLISGVASFALIFILALCCCLYFPASMLHSDSCYDYKYTIEGRLTYRDDNHGYFGGLSNVTQCTNWNDTVASINRVNGLDSDNPDLINSLDNLRRCEYVANFLDSDVQEAICKNWITGSILIWICSACFIGVLIPFAITELCLARILKKELY